MSTSRRSLIKQRVSAAGAGLLLSDASGPVINARSSTGLGNAYEGD